MLLLDFPVAPKGTLVLRMVVGGNALVAEQAILAAHLATDVPVAVSDLGLSFVLDFGSGPEVTGIRWDKFLAANPARWKNYL